MKVAILGGTGFVGSYLVDELITQGHTPRILVRSARARAIAIRDECELVPGELTDAEAMRRLFSDADAVIYNIGILREFPQLGITFRALQQEGPISAVDLARECGVRRFILMSANGVEAALTPYQRTKAAAEDYLRASGLDWTIFRPSVIYGDPRGGNEFAAMLKRDIIDAPLPAPLFYTGLLPANPGAFRLSPVHVRDVAAAFIGSLKATTTFNKVFTLGGPASLSWRDILQTIARACGKQKLMVPVPAFAPAMAAALLDRFPWFPISRDQIRMLVAGNVCAGDEIFGLLGIEPTAFDLASLEYLAPDASRTTTAVG